MNTYSYSSYEQERRRKAEERKHAPKECPHCGTPINQNLSEWDRVRYHCGADKCRKAASRANLAERKRQERRDARARVLRYCEERLDREQKTAVMNMCDMLMDYSHDEGHEIAEQVIKVIEAQRCKHDRISVLIDNAGAAKRRADKAQEYNEQLERLYKERISELEAELHVYQLLENTIHGIAARQLEKQPDPPERQSTPEPTPEDQDRARVLATLKQAGIRPIGEALADERELMAAEERERDDTEEDTEGYEEEDDNEGE